MKAKTARLEAIKMLISSRELSSQDELLQVLQTEGFSLAQATLSRDLKQLKVSKAATIDGRYVYVLPNNTLYRRLPDSAIPAEMIRRTGFLSIEFSNNLAVIKTRPGYASSLAYDIDNQDFPEIIGTIAGDDTILLILSEHSSRSSVKNDLSQIIPNI